MKKILHKKCQNCLKPFIPKGRGKRRDSAKFCGSECYYELLPVLMAGNKFWKKTIKTQFKKGHAATSFPTSKKFGSTLYEIWRIQILERDNYKCRGCGEEAQVVHHPKNRKEYPDLIIDPENGISLCRSCHINIHRKDLRK